MKAEPFVTVAYQMPRPFRLKPGEKALIREKAQPSDRHPQKLKIRAKRSGIFDARLTDRAGDKYRLMIDPKAGTVSLMNALPMQQDWAKQLTCSLMSSVNVLARQFLAVG